MEEGRKGVHIGSHGIDFLNSDTTYSTILLILGEGVRRGIELGQETTNKRRTNLCVRSMSSFNGYLRGAWIGNIGILFQ